MNPAQSARFLLAFTLAAGLCGCGSGNFGSTTSNNSSTTTTTLALSATAVTTGTSVTFTATVSPATAGGSVTFLDGTASIGTAPVSGGKATLSLGTLAAGTHSITASYAGATGYYASSSAAVSVYVSPMLTVSSITLTASPASAAIGTNILLTATATAGASGIVTFYDGATTIGSAVLAGPNATYSTSQLAAGTHSLTAVYGGSGSFAGSTSPAVTVTLR